jgi:hypothetical protein
MRKPTMSRVLFHVAVISIFGAGVTMAATSVSAQESQMLCMFQVSSCSGSECADTCWGWNEQSIPVCNSVNLCCNCYL